MTPEKILSYEPVVLTQAQRRSYFEKGYLLVERIVPEDWVARLIEITDEMVQRSRSLTESDGIFDLEPGHTVDHPRLVPPDWSGGYTSLYAMQQQEEWKEDQLATISRQTAQIRREK